MAGGIRAYEAAAAEALSADNARNSPKNIKKQVGIVNCTVYEGPEWRKTMADSRVSLCPRG
jgi:hypothetical protein